MTLINLFPQKRKPVLFKPLSVEEVFKQSLEAVGRDMYHAIGIIEEELKVKEDTLTFIEK